MLQVAGPTFSVAVSVYLSKLQGGMAAKQQMKALRAQKAAAVAAQAKQAEEQRAAAAKQVMTAPCNMDVFSSGPACCICRALCCP